MRGTSTAIRTGCFFLCLGGWVYSGSVRAEDLADSKAAALNDAVAAAVQGEATGAAPSSAAPSSDATPVDGPAAVPAPAPAAAPAPAPAATEPTSTNLNAAVVNIGMDGAIDQFTVQDMDINTALHLLSLQTKRNIIPSKDVKGQVTVNLYSVTFAEALKAILEPNGYGYLEQGNFIYVYTRKELEEIKKRDRRTVNEIFHLKYLTAADASVLIKPMLSAEGQVALTPVAAIGLPSGIVDSGGAAYATDDLLVINDYPENMKAVENAIKALDIRPRQVLIESTILRATLTDSNALGVDFVGLSGVDFSTLAANTGTALSAAGAAAAAGSTASTGTPITGSNGMVNNFLPGKGQVNAGTDFAGNVPQGGLSVGYLGNNISVFLRALEEVTDTTVVANPKILALNKQRGEVFIGQQFGYKTTSTTSTTTNETIQFLDTGTKLVFRPFITGDGYVRMEIHPEDSSGGLDGNGLPYKTSTEVTSNLMIKDGRTVVIGGLFKEQNTSGRGQVPVLGDIPVLGVAFRRTNDNITRTETIVLITPHIINDDTALYEESAKRQDDVRKMLLGSRAGLQPWAMDRLAQIWYSKALEAKSKGHQDKALMYTDWALNSSPRFIEAQNLKEELTGNRIVEADNSAIHDFVWDVIRADLPAGHSPAAAHADPAPHEVLPAAQPAAAASQPAH